MNFNKKTILIGLAFSVSSFYATNSSAQTLMTIAGEDVSKTEFENIYHKNSPKDKVYDEKALNEYLDLFINFKLKVKEARDLGLDTTAAFKNELEGYRKQLAQPYLTDNNVNDALLTEAYERMKQEVRASHILIKCDINALPKDTLVAYNRIMDIRKRTTKGEDFNKLAKQYSEDPSAKENLGDLNYFSALQMVYPFECAAYITKVGDVSMPIRTKFGYHIIKVTDKRPAQGSVLVQHIMIKLPKDATKEDTLKTKEKISEIYSKVKTGEDFSELARQFSDDKSTAKKGGELPWFSAGRMVLEFEEAAFKLAKNGDVTEPVLTQFGWHLIKRVDKKDIAPFSELKADIKNKVSKDSRSQKGKESLIAKVKKENGFKEVAKTKEELVNYLDTSYFDGKWNGEKAKALTKELFTLGGKKYTQGDFAKFMEQRQSKSKKIELLVLVNNMYKDFVAQSCISLEDTKLAQKYPEYKMLLDEYRDGILLFELTDRKVWSAAVKDTTGLLNYYEKNKANYVWEDRLEASIYKCANKDIAAKVIKNLDNKKKKLSDDELIKEINKDSQLNLSIETSKFLKGDNEVIDKLEWNPGTRVQQTVGTQEFIIVQNKIYKNEQKSLAESKGIVTADYQNFLEKEWIASLRNKYTYKVNNDVLKTVK